MNLYQCFFRCLGWLCSSSKACQSLRHVSASILFCPHGVPIIINWTRAPACQLFSCPTIYEHPECFFAPRTRSIVHRKQTYFLQSHRHIHLSSLTSALHSSQIISSSSFKRMSKRESERSFGAHPERHPDYKRPGTAADYGGDRYNMSWDQLTEMTGTNRRLT